jgi:hypothetical protein
VKLLFLDIDGVLNDHRPHQNGYSGIQSDKVCHLNRILEQCPDVQLVISSAWRYTVLNRWMTLQGFEHLLLTHGVDCVDRLHGVTAADPEVFNPAQHAAPFDAEYWKARGLKWRAQQIRDYADRCECRCFVVLDDLKLDLPELVCTAEDCASADLSKLRREGLIDRDATEVIRRLQAVAHG